MSVNRPTKHVDAADEPDSSAAETVAERPVAELEAEVTDLKDRLLRALAEQENMRRRAQRELQEAAKYAASALARDLLSTADDLRRAIESVPEGNVADDRMLQLLTGVAAIERALLDSLEKHGIRRIEPLGEPFDPNRHHAMFQVTDDTRPAGTVVEVLQPGYLHYDRLLRPAMVGVAKSSDGTATPASDVGTEELPSSNKAGC